MKTAFQTIVLMTAVISLTAPAVAGESSIVWREDYADLDSWEMLTFPRIDRHTECSILELRTSRKEKSGDSQ